MKINWLLFGCVFLFICTIQALYYPFMTAEPIGAKWWQSGILAAIGLIVGLPVLVIWETWFKYSAVPELSYWLLAIIYCAAIYVAISFVVRKIKQTHNKSLERTP